VLALLVAGGWLAFENKRLHQQISQTGARRDAFSEREQELQKELEGQGTMSAQTEQELARVREERERLGQELRRQEEQAQQRLADERRRASEQRRQSPSGTVSIASFVLTPQMRGTGQIQTISIPAKTVYAATQLQLEPDDYAAYRVVLLDQSTNQTLWRSRQLKARAAGDGKTLNASFPARLLKPQVYILRVTGVSANDASEIVGDYPFRVIKE
jgi:TolA-binding protein